MAMTMSMSRVPGRRPSIVTLGKLATVIGNLVDALLMAYIDLPCHIGTMGFEKLSESSSNTSMLTHHGNLNVPVPSIRFALRST